MTIAAERRVQGMHLERRRTTRYDIGAVVYVLRLVPWIVSGSQSRGTGTRLRHRLATH
jgi:hypothetical protein